MGTLTLSQVKLMLSDFILGNYGFKGESFIDEIQNSNTIIKIKMLITLILKTTKDNNVAKKLILL